MGLLDLKIPMTLVPTSGGEFAVRGLSLEDLVNLHQRYAAEFGGVFDQFRDWAETEAGDLPPLDQFIAKLLYQAPVLAAQVIAIAADADTDDGLTLARRLAPLDQATALQAIGRLTFRSEEDVKKMLTLVIQQVRALVDALLRTPAFQPLLEAGSGLSGE